MSVLGKYCLINFNKCGLFDLLGQWGFLIMTIIWSAIASRGIHKWNQIHTEGVSYNQSIIFMVLIKLFMIWLAILFGSSMPMLYMIFWVQAILNVVNCYILHNIVA